MNNIQIYKIIVVRNNSEKEDKCPVHGVVNWGNTKMFPDQKDLLVTPAVKQTPVFVAEITSKYNTSNEEILPEKS